MKLKLNMLKKQSSFSILVLLLLSATFLFNPAQKVRQEFKLFQNLCQKITDSDTHFRPLVQATLCGTSMSKEDPNNSKIDQALKGFGLVHLLVASGANIHFANGFIKFLPYKFRPIFKFVLFSILLLASGLEAPLLRAFIQIELKSFSDKKSLGLGHFRRVTFANLIYLILFPWDLFSLSFQLSAVASYSLALLTKNIFTLHLLIFLLMSPLLAQFQIQDPISILCNLIIAPILGPILLCVAFTVGPFPDLAETLNPMLNFLIYHLPLNQNFTLHTLNAAFFKGFLNYSFIYYLFCFFGFELLNTALVIKHQQSLRS